MRLTFSFKKSHSKSIKSRSLKKKELISADFCNTCIQSVDFTEANLINANFSNAKFSLRYHWFVFTFGLFLLLSFLAGVSLAGTIAPLLKGLSSHDLFMSKLIVFLMLGTFLSFTLKQGFRGALVGGGIASVSALMASAPLMIARVDNAVVPGAINGVLVLGIDFITVVITAFTVTGTAILTEWWVGFVAAAVTMFGATFTCLLVSSKAVIQLETLIIAGGTVALGFYIGMRSLKEDEKYGLIRSAVLLCASWHGTSFRGANLTNANFKGAALKNIDFENANLTGTNWFNTRNLDRVRTGDNYLQNPQVRQLVTTLQGQGQKFDHLNLSGINLKGANLQDASFINTNLNDANLQDANLSRAVLKQTQLDRADLTGACLTAAYIEDWGITGKTKLNGVRCEYVYMHVPTQLDPDPLRKPDNRQEVFEDGDFADFIKPIVDTIDIYHIQGVDPRAIAISFKKLAENHPDAELEIIAMEKRGQDKFLLRAKTTETADKSELSAEYFATYNQLKSLPEREIKLLLTEKEYQIRRLENMVMTALERPSFYSETVLHKGDIVSEKSETSTYNLNHAKFGGGFAGTSGIQIDGTFNDNSLHTATTTQTNDSAIKTILILASNPKTTSSLRLDEEVREIDMGLQRARKREQFDLKQRWAVRIQDVYQALVDFKPQFVHFSGHGAGVDGLVLQDDTGSVRFVETEAVAELFKLFADHVECIVLNACYSEVQAEAIAKHIPYVVGMKKEIGDLAAIKFATGFYNGLGAGESVEFAYKLGCSVIQLDGIPEHLTPDLKKKGF